MMAVWLAAETRKFLSVSWEAMRKQESPKKGKGGSLMGKLEERSNGYFVLEVTFGPVVVKRAFMASDIPLEQIPEERKTDGFYLYIPDTEDK